MNDLLYVEKVKCENGIHIVTVQRKYTIYKKGLEDFIKEINDPYFIRCHKSFAVYLKNVESFSKSSRHIWIANFEAKGDTNCLVGDTFYDMVIKKFIEYKMV